MIKKIFLLLAMALLVIGGVTVFRGLSGQHNLVVTFSDAKHLMKSDLVYLSGAPAGKIKAVAAETRQAAVTIELQKNIYDQLSSTSTFFIDDDIRNHNKKCVLIRINRERGNPLAPGTRITGVDSAFTWAVMQAGDRMAEITHSEPLEKVNDDLAKVWQDIRQAFEEIDLGKMEKELKEKSDSLRRNFNKALESESFKRTMAEIENKLKELKETLKEAGDGEAAQKLKKTLKDLFKKLEKETPERSDVKI